VRPAAFRVATMTEINARCFALRNCFNVVLPIWMHSS
jgi:hypothetical protein